MIVQLVKQRPYGRYTAHEVAENGGLVNRVRTLVVQLPDHTVGIAEPGSVWKVSGKTKQLSFEVNQLRVHEDFLKARRAEFIRPSGELLARWITRNVENLGEVKARRLVRAFDDLNEKVRSGDIDALSSVSGMSPQSAQQLIDRWPSEAFYQALEWLQQSRLPMGLADRLARVYGDDVIQRLKDDPFILISFGISIETILSVIDKLKLTVADQRKYAAVAEHVANRFCQKTGSTLIPEDELVSLSDPLCHKLNLTPALLVENAVKLGALVRIGSNLQLFGITIQEASVARFLNKCATRQSCSGSLLAVWESSLNEKSVEQALTLFESTLPFNMTSEQRAAIIKSVLNKVSIISGGAGTGKTTILKAVLSVYESMSNGMAIYQIALSGRAARRMSQSTGREAMTIAKFITEHIQKADGKSKKQLPDHLLLVIDEASMIDLLSAYKLVGILPYSTRIVFVGDVAQLPPVGSGLIFHAVMDSELAAVELTEVKRQDKDSGIHQLASGIRNSNYSEELLAPETDDVFFTTDTSESVIIEALMTSGGPEQAIILTPTRKGPLGVKALNALIQSCCDDEDSPELHYQDLIHGWIKWITPSGSELRLGDKVMVTANDYDEDIRNGDLGTITEVFDEACDGAFGIVQIDGRNVLINQSVLEKLELGYAITIHKSQGSQWKNCLLILPSYAHHMLDQTLLYTAVTRASEGLIIIGEKSLVEEAIRRGSSISSRTTNLCNQLRAERVKLHATYQ